MASIASVVMLYLALLQPSNWTWTSAYSTPSNNQIFAVVSDSFRITSNQSNKLTELFILPGMLMVGQSPAAPPLAWMTDLCPHHHFPPRWRQTAYPRRTDWPKIPQPK